VVVRQGRESGHCEPRLRERRLAFLQVALKPPHGDPRESLRFLARDQDRELERLGQTDPAELTR
jgi:hypothetical protein